MQNQEHIYHTPEAVQQQEESTYGSYEEGYSGRGGRDIWNEGEKLRAEPKSQKSMGGLLGLVVLVCAIFIVGSLLGVILSWLTWLIVVVLVLAGLGAIALNWRVVVIPMPTQTFQVMESARLEINNGLGTVAIRQGEQNAIRVSATKRASGLGVSPERMQIQYNQHGDTLNISTRVGWNLLQFGLRSIDLEITVPANCDVQLDNGAGRVAVQGTSGDIRVRTGSGRIEAHDLQGQIAMKTGSGRIEISNLQGQIDLRTGSSRIEARNLQGQIMLRTGSSRIEADNLRGQLIAQTGSGHIEVRQAALSGDSLLKTGSSSITFEGSLDPRGTYRLETGSGGIHVTLPADSAFRLNAKTGSGGVKNEFGGTEVGSGPRAQLRLKTGSGGIRIMNGGSY